MNNIENHAFFNECFQIQAYIQPLKFGISLVNVLKTTPAHQDTIGSLLPANPSLSHHARRQLKQLLLGFLDTLGIPLNTDQVAFLVVRGDADSHLVQFFDAVDYG